MQIVIDTSALIGLLDSQDIWHPAAVSIQRSIIAARLELVYVDCVLAEAITFACVLIHGNRWLNRHDLS
jgi:predicted nucleic acid-binding protein